MLDVRVRGTELPKVCTRDVGSRLTGCRLHQRPCRIYAGHGLKAPRCVGYAQLALLKVRFLRLAFSESRAIVVAILQSSADMGVPSAPPHAQVIGL